MAASIIPERGYGSYYLRFSTAGFLFRHVHNKRNNQVMFYNLRPQCNPNTLHCTHPSIYPQPFIFLSSSKGYVLGRDLGTSFYFITGNAFAVHCIIPDPPDRHHSDDDPAVISVHHDLNYHICSAIYEGSGKYTFDVYNSCTKEWVTRQGGVNLEPCDGYIRLNTGVSVHERIYWLTDGPKPSVIMHDIEKGATMIKDEGFLPGDLGSHNMKVKLQLGRVGCDVGLVVADGSYAQMFVLVNGLKWNRVSERLRITEEEEGELVPMRFESYKLEVVFCVGGKRLVMWECSDFDHLSRVVELTDSQYMLAKYDIDAVNGVPCTF